MKSKEKSKTKSSSKLKFKRKPKAVKKPSDVQVGFSKNSIPSVHPDVISRPDGENEISVILLTETEVVYKLDKLAAQLFDLIDGRRSIEKITQSLLKKTEVTQGNSKLSEEVIAAGVKKTIADLQMYNLILLEKN